MSRLFGERPLTTRSPIRTTPSVMSSRPADHAQRGRLAAPGWADEHHELAVLDLEVELVDGARSVAVDLRGCLESDPRHRLLLHRPAECPAHEGALGEQEDDRDRDDREEGRERELRLEDVDRLAAAADRRVERRRRGEQVREADRDRVLVRVREDDVRQEEVVPVGDEAEEEDERDDRLRERQRDPEERQPLAAAVDARRVEQARTGARSRSRCRRGRRRTGRTRTAGSPRTTLPIRCRAFSSRKIGSTSAAAGMIIDDERQREDRACGPGTCRARGRSPPGSLTTSVIAVALSE